MAGNLSNFLALKLLDHVLRNSVYTPPATVFLGLSTTIPTDAGGFTEVVGGAYARQSIAFSVAASREISNSGIIQFPTATAPWGTIVGWGIFDAVSAGNMLVHGEALSRGTYFSADPATDFLDTTLSGTPHGFVTDDPVQVEADPDNALPAPLLDNTTYFVRDQTAFTFKLAATAGGPAINITTAGNVTKWVARDFKIAINANDAYRIEAALLTVRLRGNLAV